MKILYITYDGLTDPLGQSQIIPYLIGLSGLGYQITILSCEKPNNYAANKDRVLKTLDKNNIRWQSVYYHRNPLLAVTNLFILYKKAVKLHKQEQFKIVHCRSYVAAFMGLYLKKRYEIKFVFDIRGFWADERIEGKIWNMNNPLYKILYHYAKIKEVAYFNYADYTVSLTNKGKNIIQNRNDIKNQPIPVEVIPCCADMDHFSSTKVDSDFVKQVKKQLNINENDFIISYLGSIGTWYMLDEMLNFFKRLIEKKPHAKFLFITPVKEESIFQNVYNRKIPAQNILIIKGDYNKIPSLLSLSKISIFFIKPVFSKNASSPTKQGEILSMGIPIICNSGVGDTAEIIRGNNVGIVVDNFTNSEYDRAILSIDKIMNVSPGHIKNIAEKYFSLKIGVNLYDRIYKSLNA